MPIMKSLAEMEANASARILSIEGGPGVRQRLFALGFHIGDTVVLQRRGAFRGPLLVNNQTTGTCLAVGRGIAQRIRVEVEDGA